MSKILTILDLYNELVKSNPNMISEFIGGNKMKSNIPVDDLVLPKGCTLYSSNIVRCIIPNNIYISVWT